MIYPKKISAKKTGIIIKILLLISVLVALLLTFINKKTTPDIHWAALSNAGIVYVWITVIYSMNKNINIAAHVMIQTIAITLLNLYIDHLLGDEGWSLNISIPIIIIIANTTMFILTILSSRRYIRYAIYQLIILLLSTLPIIFICRGMIQNVIALSYIAIVISFANLIVTIALSAGDVKDEIVRKFHI